MAGRYAVDGVSASTPLAEAAPLLLLSKAGPLFALEDAAAAGADADAVHDMRVASRRLREAMRLLSPVYPRREFRKWYRRVRQITRALGPVRDSDVFVSYFAKLGEELDGDGRRAIAFIVGRRLGQRQHELAELRSGFARAGLSGRQASFERLARSAGGDVAGRPLAEFARDEIAVRAAAVSDAQPQALVEGEAASQHALRIYYKRLRYAVEVFGPCYPRRAFGEMHATLTSFQDALGELHDAHVFLEMLRSPELAAEAALAGVPAKALGKVAALCEARASQRFAEFEGLARQHPAAALTASLLEPLAGAGSV